MDHTKNIYHFLISTQSYVKMCKCVASGKLDKGSRATIVVILAFNSRINTTLESLKQSIYLFFCILLLFMSTSNFKVS